MSTRKSNEQQERFCQEYVIDLNARRAATAAGYSKRTAAQQGSRLLNDVNVAARIKELQKDISDRLGITQDMVLKMWWDIATADVNELMEARRECCRFCHGVGHRYQRTQHEMEEALEAYNREQERRVKDERIPLPDFDEKGGTGWNPRRDPHPECPECWGEGLENVVFKDSRKLPPELRQLYEGVKQKKDGSFEFKLADKSKARELIGRHLGMLTEKIEISGRDGGPVQFEAMLERLYGDKSDE